MATEITQFTTVKNAGRLPIGVGEAAVPETAADPAGNSAVVADGFYLECRNSGGSAYTLTIDAPTDENGWAGDFGPYSIAAGTKIELWIPPRLAQRSGIDKGKVLFTGSNAALLFSLKREPRNKK
jgi:hypothetical protein